MCTHVRAVAMSSVLCMIWLLAGCADHSGHGAHGAQAADAGARDARAADAAGHDVGADAPEGTDADAAADTASARLCDRVGRGANADISGAHLFENTYWSEPVTDAPVNPNSEALIASIGADTGLHPDFGCCWHGPFGIPYMVVDSSTAPVPVSFDTADESDPGPYPIPADAPIEGGAGADGDRHVLVVDCARAKLYELFSAYPHDDGSWQAGSGAVWDLSGHLERAPYCTSADAAGLPILPGLVRYDEVAAGAIHHALRFTVSHSRKAFVPPASHWASGDTSADLPPMGMRVRLESDAELAADGVDVSGFSPQTRVIVRALQTYGMIVADNGSDWYISGAPSASWNDDKLVPELRQIKGRFFQVVKMDHVVDDYSVDPGQCQLP